MGKKWRLEQRYHQSPQFGVDQFQAQPKNGQLEGLRFGSSAVEAVESGKPTRTNAFAGATTNSRQYRYWIYSRIYS